jgi:glycosyltransferase involved in cell wall biosynthesis
LSTPKVSICLPVYNGALYLEDAIESALCQTFEDFELLIFDDQSSDRSVHIIEDYAKQDKRIVKVSNKSNVGLFANYNLCLKKAQGEFIKPFAQDDLLHPSLLEKGVAVLSAEPTVSLVSCHQHSIDSAGQLLRADDLLSSGDAFPCDQVVDGKSVVRKCLFPVVNYIGEPSTVMFRRNNGGTGFDESFHHIGDLEYWFRILMEGDYYHISETLCNFRRHEKSATLVNAKGLLGGLDLLKMARKYGPTIESFGQTEQTFLKQSIRAYSSYLQSLVDYGTIGVSTLRTEFGLSDDNPEPEGKLGTELNRKQLQSLIDFRELAFQAMIQVAELLGEPRVSREKSRVISKNQFLIQSLESELRLLVESPSWRNTRYLREISRVLSLSEETEGDSIEFDQAGDIVQQQKLYIDYLKKMIVRIKNSRSWKITRTLRAK